MKSEKMTINVELPDSCDGYKVVGIGRPRIGEWYFSLQGGGPVQSQWNSEYYAVLLEPVKKWRAVDMSDLHICLTVGPMKCQATCGSRAVQGELHTARRMSDGGFSFFVRVGDSFGWYSSVEVLE